nr:hypothetical protein [Pseudorhizobium flavum]CAD6602676.1 hypothetical protein RFYW14_01186 [Pseudorhizobium flavum]
MFKNSPFVSAAVILLGSTAHAADIDRPLLNAPVSYYGPSETAPLTSSSGLRGYIEGSYARGKSGTFELDNSTWSLRGAVNYDTGSGFNVQGDLDWARTTVEEDFDYNRFGGTGHLYYRPSQDFAFGAFGSWSRFQSDIFGLAGIPGLDDDIDDKLAGIEGAWFNDAATVYAALGYGKAAYSGEEADHYMGRLGLRYFLSDNIRFDLEGSLNRLSYDVADLDIRTLKAVANYRPETLPVTFFAGYRYDEWEPSLDGASVGSEDNHSVMAGMRVHFGSNSLKDEERSGPIWSSTSLLP